MEIKAQLKYLHIAPRKVRLVAGLLRDVNVREARHILHNLPKRAAMPLAKLLQSAVANATNNFHVSEEALTVKKLTISPGSVYKRMMPRAFGRGATIRRRTSHVLMVLEPVKSGGDIPSRKKNISLPTVGDALISSSSQIPGEIVSKRARKRPKEGALSKSKSRGFIKRVFRRKVI